MSRICRSQVRYNNMAFATQKKSSDSRRTQYQRIYNENLGLVRFIPESVLINKGATNPVSNSNMASVIFEDLSTDTCAIRYASEHVALLNFASRKRPGGGYRNGANVQEETLCRSMPSLYESLKACHHYPVPYNSVIVTPNVDIVRDSQSGFKVVSNIPKVTVVTAAAPNLNVERFDSKQVRDTLRLIYIAPKIVNDTVQVLILGAWGCGVFRNDPKQIARLMAETHGKFGKLYTKIVISIPDRNVRETFREHFGDFL